jgi:hypothetical protein
MTGCLLLTSKTKPLFEFVVNDERENLSTKSDNEAELTAI